MANKAEEKKVVTTTKKEVKKVVKKGVSEKKPVVKKVPVVKAEKKVVKKVPAKKVAKEVEKPEIVVADEAKVEAVETTVEVKTEKVKKEAPNAATTVEELFEAGAHFGHVVKKWNPKMKKYLWGEKCLWEPRDRSN
ncbi:MAG: 30S ribosomal protein S2 [Microgenomates group bacterium GW2011_GWC1_44_37]|nr:MAG: 30S ribosomal protein S2 [Microgenomates group bacterium GW2011_GWC1_44_37]